MTFSIIGAVDKQMGIGIDNKLPWRLKSDMQYFVKITGTAATGKSNAVIMGSKTWDSLPPKFKPLPGRINVVLSSRDLSLPDQVIVASSIDGALKTLAERKDIDQIYVIGGASVYAQAIGHPACSRIYLTEIDTVFNCDVFFPAIPDNFKKTSTSDPVFENDIKFVFTIYERV